MSANSAVEQVDVTLLDYWRIVWKRRWSIAGLFMLAVLTAMVVTLQMPKVYEATATLLPPVDSGGGGGGLLGGLLGGGGGASGLAASGAAQGMGIALPSMPATPQDVFVSLLKARIMADDVIKEFDLMEVYKTTSMETARKILQGNTNITITKEKVIKIAVQAERPDMAADIANFYVRNLDRLNRTVNVSKAGQNRAFIERRLGETQVHLTKAEEALKEYQTSNKTVAVEAQAAAMIQAAAMVQAQIAAQEVQIQVMGSYLSSDNPEMARMRTGLEELRRQLYVMESGKSGKGMLPGDRLHPAMITVPQLALGYLRLMRELKVQETLYSLLTSQFEQARLAEARDTPTVQVLDPAIPPERKIKPSTSFNMLIAGGLALVVGIALAFLLEHLERTRNRLKSVSQVAPLIRTSGQNG